jgi:peptide/nickel transport system ATP-binding protein
MNTMLQVRGLKLDLGTGAQARTVLHGIHFTVARGEAFGLVGESGSGKTTVLRCLAGQYLHWQGELAIDGQPLRRQRDRSLARRVQMVFQDPYGSLHPRHTVRSTLAEPLIVQGLDHIDERIDEMLLRVGLSTAFRSRFPHQISGGQRQRVAIARALILQPPVLLLDEPTSALDVSVQAEVLNLLAELRRSQGLSYLLVSHDLGVVAHLCDRLAVMQQGRIVETLSSDALCAGEAVEPYTRALVEASEA